MDRIERAAAALRANNIEAVVVDTAADAKREALARIPDGAEVHSGASKTLQETGIVAELETSSRIDWLRKRTLKMDRATQGREIRKLSAAPDVMLGSVAAVTEDGKLVTASNSGSQLGPYAAGAGKVILVVGAQKIVKDLD
ncbi:MAG TPA: LUD domain-containing protein, partial [Candidatus Limnocylindria bacterium]